MHAVQPSGYGFKRPSSDQRFASDAQGRVELASAAAGREPVRNAGRLAAEAGEPADEAGEGAHQKKHLQPSAVPGEAVFHALAITMGFEVAEAELDLHASRVQIHQLPCAGRVEFRRGHDQPRLAFAGGRLLARGRARCSARHPPVRAAPPLVRLCVNHQSAFDRITPIAQHQRQFVRRRRRQCNDPVIFCSGATFSRRAR